MMKRLLVPLLILLLVASAAMADPLPLLDNLSETITVPYDDQDPSAGQYVYTYSYPCADPEDPTAYRINSFYEYLIKDTKDYTIPNLSEYYAGQHQNVTVDISYEVTCNNDEFFSVLIHKTEQVDSLTSESWEGNTFSRLNGMPDSTFDLPRLLGTLEVGEHDDWLENRQTRKANEAVWNLVWEIIEQNQDGLYNPDYTKEDLTFDLAPESDFFLDESGNPVFYVISPAAEGWNGSYPVLSADPSGQLLLFPLLLDDIEDEM